jgi:hypothetical protein
MSLIVIYYCLKSLKISYDNGRVSVRIFYKNNLISTHERVNQGLLNLSGKKSIIQQIFLTTPSGPGNPTAWHGHRNRGAGKPRGLGRTTGVRAGGVALIQFFARSNNSLK